MGFLVELIASEVSPLCKVNFHCTKPWTIHTGRSVVVSNGDLAHDHKLFTL